MQTSIYRLVGFDGLPHPVLDTPYESMDAAEGAARNWVSAQGFAEGNSNSIFGIEVKTSNGSWRTIRYS
ncbi:MULTISPECIES: hypothetical protein [Prochlorococcus]|uniref:hypothetical protein n=1 Tax=Prochlorococcus TaxID=1218 RepID=UPI001F4D116D|nr:MULTISPECIES: hypothetical protein [Prochlorococcus]